MIFPIEEAGGSTFNKKEVLRWYESQHKDLVPFNELKHVSVYKTDSGYTEQKPKFNLKDALLPTEIFNDEARVCIGYKYGTKLVFVLEMHGSSSITANVAFGPGVSEYRYIGVSPMGKKHDGYYLNCINTFLAKPEKEKAKKFMKDQNKAMNR